MTAGRTTWWPKDAAWHRREPIVELGLEFETAGPFVIDVLCAWAQEQRNAGVVRGGFKSLARETFVTPSYARSIIEFAGANGALDDLDIDPDGRRFICRISGWQADQERGRAAIRMARKRANTEETAEAAQPDPNEQCVTEPNELRPVTQSPLHNQTKEELHPPNPPQAGGRQRSLRVFEEEVRSYTAALGLEHDEAVQCVKSAIRDGGASTNDEVLSWVRQWRPDVITQEVAA